MNNAPTLVQRLLDLETNPTLLSFYTKSKCRHCLGRGKITRNLPTGIGTWTDQVSFCECVRKNLQQEIKSNG